MNFQVISWTRVCYKVTEIRCRLPKLCFRHYRFVKSVVSASEFLCTRSCLSCKNLLVIRYGTYTQKQQTKHCIDCSMKNVFSCKISWKRFQCLSVCDVCLRQRDLQTHNYLLNELQVSCLNPVTLALRMYKEGYWQGRGKRGRSGRLT
jgi:hypothetical protein